MEWLNEPPVWEQREGSLVVTAAPSTDFWRKTHDGGIRDNGHAFLLPWSGDFIAEVAVSAEYRDQYDQAGLMVRLDEKVWLKCGIELLDSVHQVSAVVTRDFSDWSVLPLAAPPATLRLRVDRVGSTLEVRYGLDDGPVALLRQTYLTDAETLSVGPMCAAPTGSGFTATFRGFSVVQRTGQ